jgi:hypothetical protein
MESDDERRIANPAEGGPLMSSENAPTTVPSWLRWPPNCCETCTGWARNKSSEWTGRCNQSGSINSGDITDARFRCQDFIRKPEEPSNG